MYQLPHEEAFTPPSLREIEEAYVPKYMPPNLMSQEEIYFVCHGEYL